MPIAVALSLTFIAFVGLNAARVVLTLYALTLGAPASSVGVLSDMFYATGFFTSRHAQAKQPG